MDCTFCADTLTYPHIAYLTTCEGTFPVCNSVCLAALQAVWYPADVFPLADSGSMDVLEAPMDVQAPLQGSNYLSDLPFLPPSKPVMPLKAVLPCGIGKYTPMCPTATTEAFLGHSFEAIGIALAFLVFLILVLVYFQPIA